MEISISTRAMLMNYLEPAVFLSATESMFVSATRSSTGSNANILTGKHNYICLVVGNRI